MAISVAVARATQEQGEGFVRQAKRLLLWSKADSNAEASQEKENDFEAHDFAKLRCIAERNTLYFPT